MIFPHVWIAVDFCMTSDTPIVNVLQNLLSDTFRMQSHLPTALYPSVRLGAPPTLSHAYDTNTNFSTGSTSYGHQPHQLAEPSHFTNATGTALTHSGHSHSSSSTAMPSIEYVSHSAWNPVYPDKTQALSWPSTYKHPSSTNMAVSYPLFLSTESTDMAGSSRHASSSDGSNSPANTGSQSPQPPHNDPKAKDTSDKKKHHCWMCHKSFDRPSTLRKHLLVHTGEKAFQCDTCGRRFGVLSNLNRHAKKCALRPVNLAASARSSGSGAAPTSTSVSTSADVTPTGNTTASVGPVTTVLTANPSAEPIPEPSRSRKRKSAPSSGKGSARSSMDNPSKPKRLRRAPSPSRWIPDSLKHFDLTPCLKATPCPLPPVQPFRDINGWEERDSYDENASATPYHPQGWKGKLPGPGLRGKDVQNTSGGRVLIF
ncbi:hypothetical protein AcV5_004093 [Taiwanofungus camphoratus]|nr:hypothetical protein AcV5_004093 [Antrodia cinnamomea]